jgi:hypothetical protein
MENTKHHDGDSNLAMPSTSLLSAPPSIRRNQSDSIECQRKAASVSSKSSMDWQNGLQFHEARAISKNARVDRGSAIKWKIPA